MQVKSLQFLNISGRIFQTKLKPRPNQNQTPNQTKLKSKPNQNQIKPNQTKTKIKPKPI